MFSHIPGPAGWAKGPAGWAPVLVGWISDLAGWASGLAGWASGRGGRMDGRTDGQMYGKSLHSTGLCPLLGPLAKKGKEEKEKERISSPKVSNGLQFPFPALLSPWFSWWKQGSGPNRGQSLVEWGDFPFVCPFIRPSVHPSIHSSVHPFVRLSPPQGPKSQLGKP